MMMDCVFFPLYNVQQDERRHNLYFLVYLRAGKEEGEKER